MAVKVLVTAKAAKDIASIDAYLRRSLSSPAAADAFLDDLEHGIDMARQFPEMRPPVLRCQSCLQGLPNV